MSGRRETLPRLVEGLGHRADRGRAHRTAEQSEQHFTDLAGREAQDEAGQDRAVDLGAAPGISLQHLGRAEASGARHRDLDIAQLGQQMATIMAVAPVRLIVKLETVEPVVDRFVHAALDDRSQRLPAERTITFAPLQTISLHRLHHRECLG